MPAPTIRCRTRSIARSVRPRLDAREDAGNVPAASVASNPRISIVIPVYNEEPILHSAVIDLVDRLKEMGWSDYELILAENGSRDATVELAEQLAQRFPQVKTFSFGQPNYGGALK